MPKLSTVKIDANYRVDTTPTWGPTSPRNPNSHINRLANRELRRVTRAARRETTADITFVEPVICDATSPAYEPFHPATERAENGWCKRCGVTTTNTRPYTWDVFSPVAMAVISVTGVVCDVCLSEFAASNSPRKAAKYTLY